MKREGSKPGQDAPLIQASLSAPRITFPGLRITDYGLRITHHVSRFTRRPLPLANAWPVITRELKAEARNPFNYMLRVLGGAVVIAVFAVLMADQRGSAALIGARLFHELTAALLAAVMLCVPMLTADCISREKREGTLGLLFLTPLKARDIVIGKSLIHSIRALTMLLTVLPVVSLPFLLGGVTAEGVVAAATLNLSGVLLALSAGLLASVRNTEWIRAVVSAEILSAGFALLHQLFPWAVYYLLRPWGGPWNGLYWASELAVALAVFAWAAHHAGTRLDTMWQEETVAPPEPRWVKIFSDSEFWRSAFRWNKRRALDRNPIAWLQEYSWTARLTKWGWCVVMLGSQLFLLFNYQSFSYFDWQFRLATFLALGLAFSAAWSFRKERQSGALELLLVTPLRPWQLVGGRLWGLWCHFFPAYSILLFLWVFNPFHPSRQDTGWAWFFFFGFLTLPVIGLSLSLSRLHFLVAWLATAGAGLLLPYFIGTIYRYYIRRSFGMRMAPSVVMCFLEIVLGLGAWFLLERSLRKRSFAIERVAA